MSIPRPPAPGSAVVTGAASGIGRAVAATLAATVQVVAVDVNRAGLDELRDACGQTIHPVVGDIVRWDVHEQAAALAVSLAPLRSWVNNAGVDLVGGADEVGARDIDAGLRTLLHGPMYGTAVAVRTILRQPPGSIVNVSSIQAIRAFPRYFVYQTAKAGLVMMSQGVAADYGRHGIRCNAVLPGPVATPMTLDGIPEGQAVDEALANQAATVPLGRVAAAAEIADVICFLLSDRSSYVNGAAIVVDGGASVKAYEHSAGATNRRYEEAE